MGRRDELGLHLRVDAVEARVEDRGRADPQVDLGRAGAAEQGHDLLGGGAADDRIVDDDEAPPANDVSERVELHADTALAHRLRWLDERPAHVAVADHALAVRQTRPLGESGRRGRAGIGHRHDEVGVDRVLHGQLHTHQAPRLVEAAALHVGVRAGEVDEFEHAQRRCRVREPHRYGRAARLQDDELARLHVAHVLGADDVEARGLGAQDPAALLVVAPQPGRLTGGFGRRQPAQHERPESEWIADADDSPLVEDDEGIGAPDGRQHAAQRIDEIGRLIVGEQRGQELRVRARGQAGATARQPGQQVAGVHEIAVVADREGATRTEAKCRLGVLPDRRTGRRVAAVGDRQAAAQPRQAAFVEHRRDEAEVLVEHQLLAVAHRDAGRLLAAVLQREQAERGDLGRLRAGARAGRQCDAEDTAHGYESCPRARCRPSCHA